LVSLTTEVVKRNLLRGMLLVVVVLIFFLYDFRAGLIVAASIPLALLFAFICLDLQKRLRQSLVDRRGGLRHPGGRRAW
jgi:cobalt-zinc-cadmium resistance protein CzcA